jgi:hypothetical protein
VCMVSSSSRISASIMRMRKFINNWLTGVSYGRGNVWKLTCSPPSRDRRVPVVARKPSAVSGTCIRVSPFTWTTSLLADFVGL